MFERAHTALWPCSIVIVSISHRGSVSTSIIKQLASSLKEARRGAEELNHENVLFRLIQRVVHVLEEFGHTDVVLLQELDDVHALAILRLALRHVGVLLQEFGD